MWHCGKCHCVLFLQTRAHSHVKEVLLWSAAATSGWGPRKSRGPDSQAESVCVCAFVSMFVFRTYVTDGTHGESHQKGTEHKGVFRCFFLGGGGKLESTGDCPSSQRQIQKSEIIMKTNHVTELKDIKYTIY